MSATAPTCSLLKDILPPGDRVIEGSGMRQEVERARLAVAHALSGRRVAVVSSGDAGVYGMAGLVLEVLLGTGRQSEVDFRVVPGITAASAAAGLLGAPLMHDFAVISLSDLLTPWEVIRRRIEAAARGDFVVVFYNPKSRRRVAQIEEAREVLLRHRTPDTPVGVVTGAGRSGQRVVLSDLERFLSVEIGMQSVVLVGNSQSYVKDGFMVTPRGYCTPRLRDGEKLAPHLVRASYGSNPGAGGDKGWQGPGGSPGGRPVGKCWPAPSRLTAPGCCAPQAPGLAVREGRLDRAALEELLRSGPVRGLLDATHPFAVEVSCLARETAQNCGIPYLRWERPPVALPASPLVHVVSGWPEAAEKLAALGARRVFLAVGVKPLPAIIDHPALTGCRFTVRVLPVSESLEACRRLGLSPGQIVACQGPGTVKLNEALLEACGAEAFVIKESGGEGGTAEKVCAALNLNIPVVVVSRPSSDGGREQLSEGAPARVARCREEVLSWAKKIAGDTK